MPNCAPVSTSASAKPSALSRITPAANTSSSADDDPALAVGRAMPMQLGRADEVRFLGRRARDADQVGDEEADRARPSRTG